MMPQFVVAVDLGGTQIRAALVDPAGQIYRRVAHLTRGDEGPDAVVDRIEQAIREVLEAMPDRPVAGIGIGAAGPTNPTTGIVYDAPNIPGFEMVPLRNLIGERIGKPTFLGNDANLAALAELLYGAGRGFRDMIYLTVSTGIGSGIISDGRLIVGASGLAGEAGHMIVLPDGPVCGCGAFGCLEAMASGTAIRRFMLERLGSGADSALRELVVNNPGALDARAVAEAAIGGDRLAAEAFQVAGIYLGLGIVNLMNLLNPRAFVIGGSVTKAGPLLFEPMWKSIRDRAKPFYLQGLSISQAALGDDVGLQGAAALAATELGLAADHADAVRRHSS
jgi:glucokinase